MKIKQLPIFMLTTVAALVAVSVPLAWATAAMVRAGDAVAPALNTAAAASVAITGTPAGWGVGWVSQNVTMTVNASSSSTSVVAGVTVRSSSSTQPAGPLALASSESTTFMVSEEGTTEIVAAAVGTAGGSVLASAPAVVRIDKTKPKIGFRLGAPLASGWTSASAIPLTLIATDAHSGVAGPINYRIQSNGITGPVQTVQSNQTTIVAGAGRFAVEASTTDIAGNRSASTWTTLGVDAAPPSTSWVRRDFIGQAQIDFSAADSLSGVKRTFYCLDGGPIRCGSSLIVTIAPDASGPEEHRIGFWSEDLAGNLESTSSATWDVKFTITPDDGAPVTYLNVNDLPVSQATSWFPAPSVVSLVATDPAPGIGVASTWYQVGDMPVTRYVGRFTLSGPDDASIRFWSIDRNGIQEQPRSFVIHFDSGKPVSIPDVLDTYQPKVRVVIHAEDSLSGIGSIAWWVDDKLPWKTAAGSGANYFTVTADCSIAGTHMLNYVVSDLAGNREATQTLVMHVKRTPAFVLETKSRSLSNSVLPASATISGRLVDGALPIAGKRVYLQYSSSSTFAKTVSVVSTTDSKGHFAFSTGLYSKMYYRMVFNGDNNYFSAGSSSIRLLPRAYVSIPKGSATQHAYHSFTVNGTIKPGHSSKSTFRIKKYQRIDGKSVYKGYVTATVTSKGTYSTYKASLKLPAGTWRLHAYMPEDSGHASTTTSGYLSVKVSR